MNDVTHAEAVELQLFIESDGGIYRGLTAPLCRTIAKHKAKGRFNRERALRGFRRIVDVGAWRYAETVVGRGRGAARGLFDKAARDEAAALLLEHYSDWIDELAEANP